MDEYEIEPVVFLARRGKLREDELEELRAAAVEAAERVGTDSERIGSGGVDRVDQRKVKLWEEVKRAARENPPADLSSCQRLTVALKKR